jgi:hypothetical protein
MRAKIGMTEHETLKIVAKAYEIEVSVVECANGKHRKVIRSEILGRFPSETKAHEIFELVELPDLDHIIII